jgi:hypothetical protein
MGAHAVIIALLVVSPAAPLEAPASSRPQASLNSDVTARTPQELRVAVHRALRRQATASGNEQASALGELIGVYRQLRASTQMPNDEKRELAGIVRSRLLRTSKDLQRQLSKMPAAKVRPLAAPAGADSPDKQAIFAQVRGNPRARQPAVPGANAGGAAVIGAGQGPAAALAGMTAENARQLIDLIQNAVAPGSWDARGGPGTMVYFAPKMVLVARQSEEVHEQVGQLIQALRGQ